MDAIIPPMAVPCIRLDYLFDSLAAYPGAGRFGRDQVLYSARVLRWGPDDPVPCTHM